MTDLATVLIEDATLIWRNFEGKEGMYNRAGDRNFSVILDPKNAENLAKDGWNIKFREPREEGDEGFHYIQVAVGYKGKPPRITMITSSGRTNIDEGNVDVLDWVDIQKVDLILNPYEWTVNDKTGIKAYLKTMFITIEEDELERKYATKPKAGVGDQIG
jgi:hypothetical protein